MTCLEIEAEVQTCKQTAVETGLQKESGSNVCCIGYAEVILEEELKLQEFAERVEIWPCGQIHGTDT